MKAVAISTVTHKLLYIDVVNPKPALIYANVKTHKENWPYRYIMSARGTAMEKLAKWIEIQIKLFAQIHAATLGTPYHFFSILRNSMRNGLLFQMLPK